MREASNGRHARDGMAYARGQAGQMREARQGRCASKVRQKRESRPDIYAS
jgi:hypothetical protein